MCTVRYSRKMVPGNTSYSLGNICSYFGIKNLDAHRAMSDTKATVQLLHELLRLDYNGFYKSYLKDGKEVNLPSSLSLETFNNLPEKPGVYYMKNSVGKIIYIGKAKKIKSRVAQHFSGKISEKEAAFHKLVHEVEFKLMGSELLALLFEDSEIRKHWPIYNKAQKSTPTRFHIGYYSDQNGKWRIGIIKGKYTGKKLLTTYSLLSAREHLISMVKEHNLNSELCQVEVPINKNVTLEEHHLNLNNLINNHIPTPTNFVIWERGRNYGEDSFILIKQSQFHGFGFIPRGNKTTNYTELKQKMISTNSSGVTEKYIMNYINSQDNLSVSIIQFKEEGLLF